MNINELFDRLTKCSHKNVDMKNCPMCGVNTCIDCYTLYHGWDGSSCEKGRNTDVEWIEHCREKGHSEDCPHIVNDKHMKVYNAIMEMLK